MFLNPLTANKIEKNSYLVAKHILKTFKLTRFQFEEIEGFGLSMCRVILQ